jgi:hypothetical protein
MAAAGPTRAREDYCERFLDLEVGLRNTLVLASLLESVVEDTGRWLSMSKRELSVSREQLQFVTDSLKETIDDLDAMYHQRTEEERT